MLLCVTAQCPAPGHRATLEDLWGIFSPHASPTGWAVDALCLAARSAASTQVRLHLHTRAPEYLKFKQIKKIKNRSSNSVLFSEELFCDRLMLGGIPSGCCCTQLTRYKHTEPRWLLLNAILTPWGITNHFLSISRDWKSEFVAAKVQGKAGSLQCFWLSSATSSTSRSMEQIWLLWWACPTSLPALHLSWAQNSSTATSNGNAPSTELIR